MKKAEPLGNTLPSIQKGFFKRSRYQERNVQRNQMILMSVKAQKRTKSVLCSPRKTSYVAYWHVACDKRRTTPRLIEMGDVILYYLIHEILYGNTPHIDL